MKSTLLHFLLLASAAFATDLPKVPSKPVGEKKEMLFSNEFAATELAKPWVKVVPTFAVADGVLKGTQTREKDMPSPDGKSVIKAHAAVHGLERSEEHTSELQSH